MRSIKSIGLAIAAALALAASASAATWDPQNTVVTGHGNWTLVSGSLALTCTVHLNLKATGDLATTTNTSGTPAGPTLGCTNNLGVNPTVATSSAAWNATATTTTALDLTNVNMTFNLGNGVCVITTSGVSVPNNTWSNATHTLTANSAASWPVTRHGLCPGSAATMTFSGSLAFPASAVIT